MDDPYVSCPYDPIHRVPRSRLQMHIVKCQKQHPKLAVCPYNATHRLPEAEMKIHVKDCPARAIMFPEERPPENTGCLSTPRPIVQMEYLKKDDPNYEYWD